MSISCARSRSVFAGGIPLGEGVVGAKGVTDLLDFPRRRDHRLAVQDGRDLVFGEGVAFDRKRASNGGGCD